MDRDAARDRIILALDRPDLAAAVDLVDRTGADLRWVKVGLELFTAEGPSAVRAFTERGRDVFLDLKLHDIPNTVAGAVRSAAGLGAGLLTLHAEGGPEMMRAAVAARDETGSDLRLLAVTVLTSLHGDEFPDVYRDADPAPRVLAFARAAADAGVDGIVCSPKELAPLRNAVPDGFLRVTPGIRPAGSATGDQARVATPESALADGASHLVIGRAVTASSDPAAALEAILDGLSGVSV